MIENTESVETNTSEGVVEANTSEPVVETKTSEEVTKTDETAEKTSENSLINPKVEDKPTEDSKSEDSGVPDKYIFDFSKVEGLEDVKIDADDPAMQFMKPAFQDLGLTQEKANKFFTNIINHFLNIFLYSLFRSVCFDLLLLDS